MKKMAFLAAMVIGLTTVLFTICPVFAGGGASIATVPYFEGKWSMTISDNVLEADNGTRIQNGIYEAVVAPVNVGDDDGTGVRWCWTNVNIYDKKFIQQLGTGNLSWICDRKYIQGYVRLDNGDTFDISLYYQGQTMKGRYVRDKWMPVEGSVYWDVTETASGKITMKRQ
jgi:hypothetical protein